MDYPIHIAFCAGENYFQYIAVSMRSLVENNRGKELTFHILTDSVSKKVEKRFRSEFIRFNNVSLVIHLVDKNALANLECGYWTKYTWYRILLPNILPTSIHRILYLDADTLILGDLSPLFVLDMKDAAVAGCLGAENFMQETFNRCGYPSGLKYICAGVLLMNLDSWRNNHLFEKALLWEQEHRRNLKYPDQDTINFICKENKIVLPMKYGVIGQYFMRGVLPLASFRDELSESLLHPVIIHFPNQNPWKKELSFHPFQDDWINYNRKMRHPARRYFITKGWPFLKMITWRALHPFSINRGTSKQNLLLQLSAFDAI